MSKNPFTPADILIPGNTPFEKWSVIACDQFSSEREYWERVESFVGGCPSTLNMIIPEAYLADTDEDAQIKTISNAMEDYLNNNVFREYKESFIYVERTQPDGRVRKGLVGTVDLEDYDFTGKHTAIRASEGTVLERLPARINIRKAALLELPHIIVFIDDKDSTVIEPFAPIAGSLTTAYDFDLMEGGGHIRGKLINGADADNVMKAMRKLREKNDILMIVGDGNHSLAGAKVYWDELKQGLSEQEKESHPARRALVEVNNVYDPAIDFEAIHRVLFNIDAPAFVKALTDAVQGGTDYTIKWVSKEGGGDIGIKAACIGDMLEAVQGFIDDHLSKNTETTIDYIHGEDSTKEMAKGERSLGLILPAMDKSELFETVSIRGVFPRKSFSVGHARDKRYYLECRRIRGSVAGLRISTDRQFI